MRVGPWSYRPLYCTNLNMAFTLNPDEVAKKQTVRRKSTDMFKYALYEACFHRALEYESDYDAAFAT